MAATTVPLMDALRNGRGPAAKPTAAGAMADLESLRAFVVKRDPEAFTLLVERHGPMVMGQSRRLMEHTQDAEDVFQAAFLTLARKAGSIRKGESLASWLYGVVHRIAVRARQKSRRRTASERERNGRPLAPPDPLVEVSGRELVDALHHEVAQLRGQARAAVVLCYLQERTQDEAARELGLTKGALRRRLESALGTLHRRLQRRGLALSSGLLLLAVTQRGSAGSLVSAELARTTATAALAFAAGQAGTIPSAVLQLIEGGLLSMFATRTKSLAALLAALLLTATGLGTDLFFGRTPKPPEAAADSNQPPDPKPTLAVTSAPNAPKLADSDEGLPKHAVVQFGPGGFRHDDGRTVGYTADGKQIWVYEKDHSVRVLDAASGALVRRFTPTPEEGEKPQRLEVQQAWFLGQLARVLTFRSGHAYLWDLDKGTETRLDLAEGVRCPHDRSLRVAAPQSGRILATIVASEDHASAHDVLLFDVEKNREIRRLKPERAMLNAVAFSGDGKQVAAGDDRLGIWLWNAENGKLLRRWNGHRRAISAARFSPDGRILATGGEDQAVRFWNVETGKQLALINVYAGNRGNMFPKCLEFSAGGDRLMVSGGLIPTTLWKINVKAPAAAPETEPELDVRLIAHVNLAGEAMVNLARDAIAEKSGVQPHAFDPRGKSVAFAGKNGQVAVFDTDALAELNPATGHTAAITCLAVSPDGKTIATGSADSTIRLWERETGKHQMTLEGHTGKLSGLAFSPNGKTLASAAEQFDKSDEWVRLWDVKTGEVKHRLAGGEWVIFTDEGKKLATRPPGSDDGHYVSILEYDLAKPEHTAKRRPGAYYAIDSELRKGFMLRKGRDPATAEETLTLEAYDIGTENLDHKLYTRAARDTVLGNHPLAQNNPPAVSPGAKLLALNLLDGTVRIWDLGTGAEAATLGTKQKNPGPNPAGIGCPKLFSADGKLLAVARGDRTIEIYDATTSRLVTTLPGQEAVVSSMQFTADSKFLVTAHKDRTVTVWKLPGPKE